MTHGTVPPDDLPSPDSPPCIHASRTHYWRRTSGQVAATVTWIAVPIADMPSPLPDLWAPWNLRRRKITKGSRRIRNIRDRNQSQSNIEWCRLIVIIITVLDLHWPFKPRTWLNQQLNLRAFRSNIIITNNNNNYYYYYYYCCCCCCYTTTTNN